MGYDWHKILIDKSQVALPHVLRCGQSFRWRLINGVWSIGLKNRVLMLKQEDKALYYTSVGPGQPGLSDEELIKDYFNLQVDLVKLYREWTKDKRFHGHLAGIRILRQDPWENLCSFICSSNNNIKRISKMVESLCREFGPYIATVDGHEYHDFPAPEALAADSVEGKLRDLGFGYRAKYINITAKMICDMPDGLNYLQSLRDEPYSDAHSALLAFSGVGPKVADCVCLMSLDKHNCVPVDTHVWQIATRDYRLNAKNNPKGHQAIQRYFEDLWGDYAGWAHSVLFAADLSDLDNGINVKTEPLVEVKTESILETKLEP